jgi:hypothetical protein
MGLGHKDTFDENRSRILDIVNRGEQSPWVKMFVPPPETLKLGNDAVRAWAANIVHDFDQGLRPDLIDWKAFTDGLQEQVSKKGNWDAIVATAMEKAKAAGLDVSNAQVQSQLGIELSPEAAAALKAGQTVADAFNGVVSKSDPAGAVVAAFIAGVSDPVVRKTMSDSAAAFAGVAVTGFSDAVQNTPIENVMPFLTLIAGPLAPLVAAYLKLPDV